jgi:hypothetical protein
MKRAGWSEKRKEMEKRIGWEGGGEMQADKFWHVVV